MQVSRASQTLPLTSFAAAPMAFILLQAAAGWLALAQTAASLCPLSKPVAGSLHLGYLLSGPPGTSSLTLDLEWRLTAWTAIGEQLWFSEDGASADGSARPDVASAPIGKRQRRSASKA